MRAEAWHTLRLAWRLLGDRRVPWFLKLLIPGLALVYMLLPIDVAPDLLPLLGQLDDLAVIFLAAYFLITMSPPAVVEEHEADLRRPADPSERSAPSEYIDAEYRLIEE